MQSMCSAGWTISPSCTTKPWVKEWQHLTCYFITEWWSLRPLFFSRARAKTEKPVRRLWQWPWRGWCLILRDAENVVFIKEKKPVRYQLCFRNGKKIRSMMSELWKVRKRELYRMTSSHMQMSTQRNHTLKRKDNKYYLSMQFPEPLPS